MVKKVELSFFLRDCPNRFLMVFVNRKMGFVIENLENSLGATKICSEKERQKLKDGEARLKIIEESLAKLG